MKIKYILMALLAAVIGIGAGLTFSQSEAKMVKKQFGFLSEWVAKDPGEKLITTANKTKNIGTLFSEGCSLKIPIPLLSGRYRPEEISVYAAAYRSYFSKLSLQFYDLVIDFPKKGMARVTLTTRLRGRSTTGESLDEIRELRCLLKKIEKRWLFTDLEVIEVLRK